ncbi:uncharacterized protein SPAPADRAFT_57630 [Spathaspora passalidarum NRRL Y-27907]|uniref:Uncharacterized protein n=1 Tax=Spathaspora passalidarum (strain NRRL Y-27907 / 11-Y1) TaxID=619300 RepID=G3AVN0_SPAPN|nr:uncharacterized protein SPAPADRAFT_57630 [Spathaspora passalidarum NRRL Y-27907]EGW30195.1 hypothetical protein SPAPADRAFT_57630 [Spathaspora passalidarum NRRL Y-27907]
MSISNVSVSLSNILQLTSICYQLHFNKVKKSIYGLSYDMIILALVSAFTSMLSTILYSYDSLVRHQYVVRYSQYPEIPISYTVLILETVIFFAYTVLFRQLFTYSKSRNTNQGISHPCTFLLSTFFVILVYLVYMVCTSEPLYVLDIVDFIWMISKVSSAVKYIPQISMNWFGECVRGLHHHWLLLEGLAVLFMLISRYSMDVPFWNIPVNYPSWFVIGIQTSCIIILWRQFLIYAENKPRLKYAE